MATFNISINDGLTQQITTKSGVYEYAVAAVPALFDIELPAEVTIWSEFSEFRYRLRHDDFGHLRIEHLVCTARGE